jgi:TonB family protein
MADSNAPKQQPPNKDDDWRKSPFITTSERITNFTLWAIVLSLLIHGIAAPFFPSMKNQEENQQVEKVSVRHKIHIPTPPPPTPTPKPTPTPPPIKATPPPHPAPVQPKLKLNVVHTHSTGAATEHQYDVTKGTEQGVPQGQGTGPPASAPPATPAPPACAVPFKDATSPNPVAPEYPDSARELGLGDVTVEVEVTVGPTGTLEAASIQRSGGNVAIDQAALRAARESTYTPKIVNCQPTSGTYLFRADFTSNS